MVKHKCGLRCCSKCRPSVLNKNMNSEVLLKNVVEGNLALSKRTANISIGTNGNKCIHTMQLMRIMHMRIGTENQRTISAFTIRFHFHWGNPRCPEPFIFVHSLATRRFYNALYVSFCINLHYCIFLPLVVSHARKGQHFNKSKGSQHSNWMNGPLFGNIVTWAVLNSSN